MLPIQTLLQKQTRKGIDLLTKSLAELSTFSKDMDEFFQNFKRDIDEYVETGRTPIFQRTVRNEDKSVAVNIKKEVTSASDKVLKETQTLKAEPREIQKNTDFEEHIAAVSVQKEKNSNSLLHKESTEFMASPLNGSVPKKAIKIGNMRNTRAHIKKQRQLEEQHEERKFSNVCIQNPPTATIDFSTNNDKTITRSKVKETIQNQQNQTATANTTRIQTRTVTRANKKLQEELTKILPDPTSSDSSKLKSKLYTPIGTNRFVLTHCSNTIPQDKEGELKRKRNVENLQKREALFQAQLEEKRRIRAEKQLKVQQAREAKEQERMKRLEMKEKLKEEKLKQHLVKKKMKIQKQKEELEKKMQMVKQRAIAEKKDQELPIYLRTKAPLLSTPHCYDSDAEESSTDNFVLPKWLTEEDFEYTLKCQHYMLPKLLNTFFCVTPQTIDLTEIFQGIDSSKLKRTSSGV